MRLASGLRGDKFWLGLVLALAGTGAAAAEQNGLPHRFFDTERTHQYGDPTDGLRRLIAASTPRPRGPQHFCIVGYDDPQWRSAEIHWVEGRRLILWEGSDVMELDAIRFSRNNLDLDHDVVPTIDDIHGSTYLVTRAWVRQVLADCAAHGRRYVIG